MKTTNKFIRTVLLLFVTTFFISCGSDDNSSNNNNDDNGAMNGEFRAKLNGVTVEANKYINSVIKPAPQPTGTIPTLQIVGQQKNDDKTFTIDLRVKDFTGVGTYDIHQNNHNIVGASVMKYVDANNTITTWIPAYNGTVKIGEIKVESLQNNRITGTFYFKSKNQADTSDIMEVTDGYFDFTY